MVRIHTDTMLPTRPPLTRTRWVTACLAGEALGLAVTAAVMGTLNVAVGEPGSGIARTGVWAATVIAGGLGGCRRGQPAAPRPVGGWVGVNAVGWAAALAWIFLLAAIPDAGWPVWAVVLDGVAAGLGSGLAAGLVTSVWVPRLQPTA
jgi:hypothetical protein